MISAFDSTPRLPFPLYVRWKDRLAVEDKPWLIIHESREHLVILKLCTTDRIDAYRRCLLPSRLLRTRSVRTFEVERQGIVSLLKEDATEHGKIVFVLIEPVISVVVFLLRQLMAFVQS